MVNWLILTLVYGTAFSPIVPLSFIRRWKDISLWIILIFILFSFGTDMLALLVIKGNNSLLLHIYGFVEAMILFWFYSVVLNKSKQWILLLASIYGALYVIDSIFIEFNELNRISRSVECILFIFLALLLFYQFFQKEENIYIEQLPLFWINIALLTYFSGALFSFTLSKVILPSNYSWVFHNLSNILKNLLLAVGLWKARAS